MSPPGKSTGASSPPRRVLGIDPGSLAMGWGLVRQEGPSLVLEASGVLRAPRGEVVATRLVELHHGLAEILDRLLPDAVAVEAGFGARHARAALVLGHARGAALLTIALRNLPVTEYPPAMVKKTVTGSGAADKLQVRKMVEILIKRTLTGSRDESDAIAVALCHLQVGGTLARFGAAETARPRAVGGGTVSAAWASRARDSNSPRRR